VLLNKKQSHLTNGDVEMLKNTENTQTTNAVIFYKIWPQLNVNLARAF